jgi:hypothetical protein
MGHDAKGHLLLFYNEKSMLASKSTCLTIGEEKYPVQVWKEISRRPFFTAYQGTYSVNNAIGRLAAGEQTFDQLSQPKEYVRGEQWIYRLGDGTNAIYSVTEREGEIVTIEEGRKRITAEVAGDELRIMKIELRDREGNLALQFQPAFPDLVKMTEERLKVGLNIEIDGHLDEMTGDITVERQQGNRRVLFAPTKPDWATAIEMEVEIAVKDTSYKIRAKTTQAKNVSTGFQSN